MFCTDKLLGDIAKVSCPQGILRGFTGKIVIKDWRGFNDLNPLEAYKDQFQIDADPLSILPTSTPEVRDDNLTVYTHGLSFRVKNVNKQALEIMATHSNIPLIIELELRSGEIMKLFQIAGAKLLPTNDYGTQLRDYTMVTCQHYFRDAREKLPAYPILPYTILSLTERWIWNRFTFTGASGASYSLDQGKMWVGIADGDSNIVIQAYDTTQPEFPTEPTSMEILFKGEIASILVDLNGAKYEFLGDNTVPISNFTFEHPFEDVMVIAFRQFAPAPGEPPRYSILLETFSPIQYLFRTEVVVDWDSLGLPGGPLTTSISYIPNDLMAFSYAESSLISGLGYYNGVELIVKKPGRFNPDNIYTLPNP